MTSDHSEWPELGEGEIVLDDPSEQVWRQVHPQRLRGAQISSEAFVPGRNDEKMLSCSREQTVTAEDAIEFHTAVLGKKSAGAAVITVNHVRSAEPVNAASPPVVELRAIDDSAVTVPEDEPKAPGHTYLDYRPFGSSRIEKKAKQLAYFANEAGLRRPSGTT